MNLTDPAHIATIRQALADGADAWLVIEGDPPRTHPHCVPIDPPGKNRRWRCQACGVTELGVTQGHCSAPDRDPCSWCGWVNTCAPDCPGVSLALSMTDRLIGPTVHPAVADYVRHPQPLAPPAGWVALTGACETCLGEAARRFGARWQRFACPSPDCLDGRKRVTFTVPCEGPAPHGLTDPSDALVCSPDGSFPLAVATVDVLPVTNASASTAIASLGALDRLPVPGKDWVARLSDLSEAEHSEGSAP